MDDLLRSMSWHAEKLFRKRHHFASVLFLTETLDGHRQLFESGCQASKQVTATDQQLLEALADETREDFAILGVARFCVAYLARRVTVIRPLDPNSSMQETTTKRQGIVIELHDGVETPVRLFREILRPPRGKPVLAPAVSLDCGDGPYDQVLKLDTACGHSLITDSPPTLNPAGVGG